MILQVQDILKDAMGLIGVIEIDETPSATEMDTALRALNVMVDRWASQRLLLRATINLTVPLTTNKYSYTVGKSGCDVTATKPTRLYTGFIRDSDNTDNPIQIIDMSTYNSLTDKIVSVGQPMYVAYDPGDTQQVVQNGTIYVYYPPDQSYSLFLEVDTYLTEFVNLTDAVTFDPAYYEALIYNLAVRLFRYYNGPNLSVPADIVAIAGNSLNNLKTMNSTQIIAGMELPGKLSVYNIYTDNWG